MPFSFHMSNPATKSFQSFHFQNKHRVIYSPRAIVRVRWPADTGVSPDCKRLSPGNLPPRAPVWDLLAGERLLGFVGEAEDLDARGGRLGVAADDKEDVLAWREQLKL